MAGPTSLKGFDRVGDDTLNSIVQSSLITFFEWGLIDKGNYFNVNIPTTGHYGGDKHRLRLVDDPNYTKGQVWEGFRSNWVWQSGNSTYPLSQSPEPIQVSGVYINGAYKPLSTVGTYAHHVEYPAGRIVFDSAIPTSTTVEAEFSYTWINVIPANSIPWFRELQYRSQRVDSDHFLQDGSGDWSQLGQSRMQMPSLAVEIVPRRRFAPYQLGGGTYVTTDVLFHAIAENEYTRDKIIDIVSYQNEKTIYLLNTNRMAEFDKFPLDYRGSISDGAMIYPDLVKPTGVGGFQYHRLRFDKMYSQEMTMLHPSLYTGVVRASTEVIMPTI